MQIWQNGSGGYEVKTRNERFPVREPYDEVCKRKELPCAAAAQRGPLEPTSTAGVPARGVVPAEDGNPLDRIGVVDDAVLVKPSGVGTRIVSLHTRR